MRSCRSGFIAAEPGVSAARIEDPSEPSGRRPIVDIGSYLIHLLTINPHAGERGIT